MKKIEVIVIVLLVPLVFLASCAPEIESTGESDPTPPPGSVLMEPNPTSRGHLTRSLRFYEEGDFQGALREAMNALVTSPGASEPYRLVSKIYTDIGRDQDGIEFFREATRQYPDQSHPWFYKGFHEFHRHLWKEALVSFEQAAALDPENPECHLRRGLILQYMGEFDRSLAELERAYALSPRSPIYAFRLVNGQRISGKYDDAERTLTEALAVMPDSADLHYALAQLRLRLMRDDDAETALERAITLDPTLAKAHKDLAGVLFRMGRKEEARRELAIAERLTDYSRRKSFLMERLGVNPDQAILPLLLAELELTEGRFLQSLRWFTRAEVMRAPASRISAGRAEAYAGSGKTAAGEAELSKLSESGDGRVDLARAAIFLARGDVQEAAGLLDRALDRGPSERDFLRRTSDLYARSGRTNESLALLERAESVPRVPTP